VFDERGNVGLVKPGAEGLQVTGRFRLFDDRARDAWAHPVLTGGRLYLRYHDALWCYDVKARSTRTKKATCEKSCQESGENGVKA